LPDYRVHAGVTYSLTNQTGRKPIRATAAKEVGMKNPAEKTTVRPNQNLKLKRTIRRLQAVMKAGFILITHWRPDFDCGTQFRDNSNRKPDLMPCNPQSAGRRRGHRLFDVPFG
jgi:hypothetical protein